MKLLQGVRVVQLAGYLPGPLAGRILADMGADVTTVEAPGKGDPTRNGVGMGAEAGETIFNALNAGKRSVTVDFKDATQVAQLHGLLAKADAALWSYRPGALDACGMDPASLRAKHPHLVICAITGYGLSGPLAARAGHDINYLARAGVFGISALPANGTAHPLPVQLADVAGGSYIAATQLLAALVRASRTADPAQRGCVIDAAMCDGANASLIVMEAARRTFGPELVNDGRFLLCGGVPCYHLYPTHDGRHLAFGALEHPYWVRAVRALGLPTEFESPKKQFAMGDARDVVVAAVAEKTRQQPLAHWAAVFDKIDAMVDPALTPEEAERSDNYAQRWPEALRAPGGGLPATRFVEWDAARKGWRVVPTCDGGAERRAPELGEHNSILRSGL